MQGVLPNAYRYSKTWKMGNLGLHWSVMSYKKIMLAADNIQMLINSSWAVSHFSWLKITDISGTISVPVIRV
jgi:hypothetical protein